LNLVSFCLNQTQFLRNLVTLEISIKSTNVTHLLKLEDCTALHLYKILVLYSTSLTIIFFGILDT